MRAMLQVVRGVSLGGVIAGCVLAVVLVVALMEGANRLIFPAVALAGLVYWLIPASAPRLISTGSSGVAAIGLVAGVLTGFGWLEISLVAGGALGAILALVRLPGLRFKAAPAALLAVAIVLIALIPLIVEGETLGHDESAYALKARTWLEGTPETGWSLHRGPALSGFGYLVLAVGGDEPLLRSIGWLSLAGIAAATWWLASMVAGRTVGAVASVAVVAGPAILRRATEYLTDLPSAALLVVCMAVVWNEFQRRDDGPTYRLLWMIPLAVGAFYLRYQSILAFGVIGLMILVLWWPKVRKRPGPLVASLVAGVAGLAPHALFAMDETGSPLGVLLVTGDVAGREYFGEGLVDYALLLGWPLAGLLGLPLVVFFLWWLVTSWRRGDWRDKMLFLAIPAIGQVVILGLVSHGEPRFVFFPLALVAIGAAAGAVNLTAGWPERVRGGARLGLILLLMGSVALSVTTTRSSVENRVLSNEPVELAGEFVAEESGGGSCGVLTSYAPQVTFYSGCFTDRFRSGTDPDAAIAGVEGDEKFMILVEDGKRQPTGADLDGLLAATDAGPFFIEGERDSAVVFGLEEE